MVNSIQGEKMKKKKVNRNNISQVLLIVGKRVRSARIRLRMGAPSGIVTG